MYVYDVPFLLCGNHIDHMFLVMHPKILCSISPSVPVRARSGSSFTASLTVVRFTRLSQDVMPVLDDSSPLYVLCGPNLLFHSHDADYCLDGTEDHARSYSS